jgi:KRAB domain-containing zinc finger protein
VLKQLPTEIKEEQSLSELVIDFREEDEEETSDFGAEGGFLSELAHSHSQSVGEMIACSYCGQEFAGHKRLSTHVRQHHTSVCCVTCGETFEGERSLKRHQKSAHGRDGVPVLACELCGKRCRSLSDLQTHLEEHKGEQFACPQCAKLFRTQRRLTKHIQGVHEGGYRNPASEADYAYACDVCGRKFHLKTNFNRHKLKHTEERSQMCSICGSTFKSLPDLKRHVEGVHDKSRKKVYQYKCDVCNKHFYMKSHLTEHMYSHSTEKTFKCSLCDLALKSPQNLNRHLRKVHDNADKNKKSRIKRSQWPNKG